MRKITFLIYFFNMTLILTTAAFASDLAKNDLITLKTNGEAWLKAWKAHDWTAIGQLYTDDAILFASDIKEKNGRTAIIQQLSAPPESSNEMLEQVEVTGADNWAFVRGTMSFTIASKEKQNNSISGKYFEIWKKQTDGTWKIFRHMYTFDVPIHELSVTNIQDLLNINPAERPGKGPVMKGYVPGTRGTGKD